VILTYVAIASFALVATGRALPARTLPRLLSKVCASMAGIGALIGAYYAKLNPPPSPEGWFLSEALQIRENVRPRRMKVGVVGGFSTRAGIEGALRKGMDFVSTVSIVCADQLAVKKMLARELDSCFHPQRAPRSAIGFPAMVELIASLTPAHKSPLKLPSSSMSESSANNAMVGGYAWLWCCANLAKLADGTETVPMPGVKLGKHVHMPMPGMFAQGNAKMGADAAKLKRLKPYWKNGEKKAEALFSRLSKETLLAVAKDLQCSFAATAADKDKIAERLLYEL